MNKLNIEQMTRPTRTPKKNPVIPADTLKCKESSVVQNPITFARGPWPKVS